MYNKKAITYYTKQTNNINLNDFTKNYNSL